MLQQWKGEVVLKHVMWEDLQQHPGWGYLGCALRVSTLSWTKAYKLQGWFNSHKAISAGQEKMAWAPSGRASMSLASRSQQIWDTKCRSTDIQPVPRRVVS